MQKIRVVPIMITAAICAVVLFGGWAIYKHTVISAPLSDVLKATPGVVHAANPKVDQEKVSISVTLDKDASLRHIYGSIMEKGKEAIGDRKVELEIEAVPNKQLDDMWYSVMFKVAEAMENKTYSQIPEAMKQVTDQTGTTAITEMDDKNIYITMKNDDASKYIILPRESVKLGVWTHA